MFVILDERSHLQVFLYGNAKEIQRQLEVLKLDHQRETGGGSRLGYGGHYRKFLIPTC